MTHPCCLSLPKICSIHLKSSVAIQFLLVGFTYQNLSVSSNTGPKVGKFTLDGMPIYSRAPLTHFLTPWGNLASSVYLPACVLDSGRKPETQDETHFNTERTYKILHRQYTELKIEPWHCAKQH